MIQNTVAFQSVRVCIYIYIVYQHHVPGLCTVFVTQPSTPL